MRRVVPWALVGLVAVAGLAGALLGVANRAVAPPAQPSVSAIVAATRSAGTARFTYSSVAASRNPLLRSVSAGKGAVDFRTGSVTTVERSTDRNIEKDGNAPSRQVTQTMVDSQIWIKHSFYTQLNVTGQPVLIPWIQAKVPTGSSGPLGVLDEVDPFGFLDGELSIHGTRVERLQSESVGGMAATKYRIVVPTCNGSSTATDPQEELGTINIWLDGQGRLVQVRDVFHLTDPVKSLSGRSTTVSVVRLFDFGAPVTISAPKEVRPEGQGGSVIFFSMSPKGCHS